MQNIDYKHNNLEINYLIKLLNNLSPTDDIYQYLMNELLIYVYTSYENFLKKILITLFSDAKRNYKYNPFLIDHSLWGVVINDQKSFIVPKGKIDDLKANFPLIKDSYFIDELSAIDTLILERNAFAHTGQHGATLEQILNAYVTSQYIIKYLNFCYITSTDKERNDFINVQIFFKTLSGHIKGCIRNIKGDTFSPNITAFDCHYEQYKSFKNKNIFKCHPDIHELSKEENFIFLSDYKGSSKNDFMIGLESLENKMYLKAFNVANKDTLGTTSFIKE